VVGKVGAGGGGGGAGVWCGGVGNQGGAGGGGRWGQGAGITRSLRAGAAVQAGRRRREVRSAGGKAVRVAVSLHGSIPQAAGIGRGSERRVCSACNRETRGAEVRSTNSAALRCGDGAGKVKRRSAPAVCKMRASAVRDSPRTVHRQQRYKHHGGGVCARACSAEVPVREQAAFQVEKCAQARYAVRCAWRKQCARSLVAAEQARA